MTIPSTVISGDAVVAGTTVRRDAVLNAVRNVANITAFELTDGLLVVATFDGPPARLGYYHYYTTGGGVIFEDDIPKAVVSASYGGEGRGGAFCDGSYMMRAVISYRSWIVTVTGGTTSAGGEYYASGFEPTPTPNCN